MHDDFLLQTSGVGKLPDLGRIVSGNAGRGSGRHGAGRAGRHHAGFRARKLGQALAGGVLQLKNIDEMMRGGLLGGADFGQL